MAGRSGPLDPRHQWPELRDADGTLLDDLKYEFDVIEKQIDRFDNKAMGMLGANAFLLPGVAVALAVIKTSWVSVAGVIVVLALLLSTGCAVVALRVRMHGVPRYFEPEIMANYRKATHAQREEYHRDRIRGSSRVQHRKATWLQATATLLLVAIGVAVLLTLLESGRYLFFRLFG